MWKRILFQRSGGYWLFWGSAVYLLVGMYCAFFQPQVRTELIQIVWIAFLVLPFTYPPLGRWLNMDVTWDKKMNFLTWLGFNKMMEDTDPKNVVKLPVKLKPVEPVAPPPKKPQEHYRVGFDDEGRTTLTLMSSGSSMTLSMTQDSCEQLIKMLRSTYKEDILE